MTGVHEVAVGSPANQVGTHQRAAQTGMTEAGPPGPASRGNGRGGSDLLVLALDRLALLIGGCFGTIGAVGAGAAIGPVAAIG